MTLVHESIDPVTIEPPEALIRPPFAEQLFIVAMMLVYSLGLPLDWFSEPSAQQLAGDTNSSTGPLSSLVFAFLAGVGFMIVLPRIELLVPLARLNKTIVVFIGWILLSTFWSVDFATTGRRSLGLVVTVFIAFYLVLRLSRRQLLRLSAVAIAISMVVHSAFALALPQFGRQGDVWSGVHPNKNTLGQYAALSVIILLLQGLDDRRSRWWVTPMIGLSIYALLKSESKTSLAAAVLLCGLLVIFVAFRARRTLFGAVVVSLTSASIVGFLFSIAALPFITGLLDKDITLTGRTQLWGDIIPELGVRPWLGSGYSAFWNGWQSPAHAIWIANEWTPPSAHNAALDYLLQLGVVGLMLFLLFLASAVVRGTALIRDVPGWSAMTPLLMVSFMLMFSVTESGIVDRSLPFLLVVAFTSGSFLRPAPTTSDLDPSASRSNLEVTT